MNKAYLIRVAPPDHGRPEPLLSLRPTAMRLSAQRDLRRLMSFDEISEVEIQLYISAYSISKRAN